MPPLHADHVGLRVTICQGGGGTVPIGHVQVFVRIKMHDSGRCLDVWQGKCFCQSCLLDGSSLVLRAGTVIPIHRGVLGDQAQHRVGAVRAFVGKHADAVEAHGKMLGQLSDEEKRLIPHTGSNHMGHSETFVAGCRP